MFTERQRHHAAHGGGHDGAVAGYDFEFAYNEVQEPIVHVCLAAGRARARQLGLSWRWRTLVRHHVLLAVNGNSRRMDLLGYRLERDLPLLAEGCDMAGMTRVQRQRVGRGFADMVLRGRHVEQDEAVVLRGVSETRWYYPPYDYECPSYPRLHARLSTTEEVLVAWNFQEVAPEVLLEELHTASELILEETVNRRSRRLSFAELVAAADKAGTLHQLNNQTPPVDLLLELKDLRKHVRHRAAKGAGEWLDTHWEEVAILLERLVVHLNRSANSPPGDR